MSNLTVKIANINDAKKLLNIYSYYVKNTAISFEYEVPSLKEFKSRIQKTLINYPYIAAFENGEVVGYAYLAKYAKRSAYLWSAETSVYIDKNFRRMGIGSILYSILEIIAKYQNIQNLYACVANSEVNDNFLNNGSELFHLQQDFKKVGHLNKCGYKFGNWYDIVLLEKTIGEHKQPTENFIPFANLKKDLLENILKEYKN